MLNRYLRYCMLMLLAWHVVLAVTCLMPCVRHLHCQVSRHSISSMNDAAQRQEFFDSSLSLRHNQIHPMLTAQFQTFPRAPPFIRLGPRTVVCTTTTFKASYSVIIALILCVGVEQGLLTGNNGGVVTVCLADTGPVARDSGLGMMYRENGGQFIQVQCV